MSVTPGIGHGGLPLMCVMHWRCIVVSLRVRAGVASAGTAATALADYGVAGLGRIGEPGCCGGSRA